MLPFKYASLALFAILGVLCSCQSLLAEQLAYQWTPGQKFSYQVEVVVDTDSETITYRGVIHYTVGAVDSAKSTVTYRGGLAETKKRKSTNRSGSGPFGSRGFGPPSFPSPFSRPTFRGKIQTTNKLTITPRGRTLALDGDSQLPYLLGNVSLLPFEALPAGDVQSWTDDGGVSITESSGDDRGPFGRFGPMSPFARNNNDSVQAASELASFEIQSTEGDLVTANKAYRLSTPQISDNPSFNMTGKGTWTFDTSENVPHACEMQFSLEVKVKNTTTAIPISVNYTRISAEKLAEMEATAKKRSEELARAAAEKKRIAETPLTRLERKQTLTTLARGEPSQVRATLEKLATKSLAEPDPAVANAVQDHLSSNDPKIAKAAHNALTKWSPDYARRKALEKSYKGPSPVKSTGLVVESGTRLVVGQIVQARRRNRGSFWYPAKIKSLLPGSKVELVFLTFGDERPHSTEVVARNNIQLAPPELTQSDPPNTRRRTPSKSTTETAKLWTDATGRFKVSADFMGIGDGNVKLRRSDGKTMEIPLDKLSPADQTRAQQLEAEKQSQQENPFKLVE